MKNFVILLLLISFAIPVDAKTCRNGRMTIYHNSNYGYYPNNHVYSNYNNAKEEVKPVYAYYITGSGPSSNSQKSLPKAGYISK